MRGSANVRLIGGRGWEGLSPDCRCSQSFTTSDPSDEPTVPCQPRPAGAGVGQQNCSPVFGFQACRDQAGRETESLFGRSAGTLRLSSGTASAAGAWPVARRCAPGWEPGARNRCGSPPAAASAPSPSHRSWTIRHRATVVLPCRRLLSRPGLDPIGRSG